MRLNQSEPRARSGEPRVIRGFAQSSDYEITKFSSFRSAAQQKKAPAAGRINASRGCRGEPRALFLKGEEINLSRKLDKSIKKINDVFEQMYKKGVTASDKKERWSKRTVETYKSMTQAMMREIHSKFGIGDITRVKPEHVERIIEERTKQYFQGQTKEAYNIKTLIAAIKALNVGIAQTNVFKKPFSIANTDKIRQQLKEQNVIRKGAASSVLRATREDCEKVIENIRSQGYNTATREMALHVSRIALETGGRISGILRLKSKDIDVQNNKIIFRQDKGGLTREVKITKETAEYLKQLKEGKNPDDRLFVSKRRDGTIKSVEETRKEIEKVINQAARELTRTEKITIKDEKGNKKEVEVQKRFTTHSFRKAFALERTNYYYNKFKSKSAIDRYVAKRVEQNPKIAAKLDVVRERINKNRKTPRDLTRQEYSIFFTSVDLGHFRNDVINQFYTTFKEVKKYYDENEKRVD